MELHEFKQNPDKLLDQDEAAATLKKSRAWMERARWARNGPPFIKIGKSVHYKAGDILDFIEGGRVSPANRQQAD